MSEKKFRFVSFRITAEQARLLEAQASASGFGNKSSYVRTLLFTEETIKDKIDEIHKKIVGESKNAMR